MEPIPDLLCIILSTPVFPTLEKIQAGFTASRLLTATDALIAHGSKTGILVDNLTAEKAETANQALRTNGIDCQVIAKKLLVTPPAQPPVKLILTLNELLEEQAENKSVTKLEKIDVISVGKFDSAKREKTQDAKLVEVGRGRSQIQPAEYNDITSEQLTLSLLCSSRNLHLNIVCGETLLQPRLPLRGITSRGTFHQWVCELKDLATSALQNPGFEHFCVNPLQPPAFFSSLAFERQLRWLFWLKRTHGFRGNPWLI